MEALEPLLNLIVLFSGKISLVIFCLTEKERYLASFQGSNELDIKMRIDRRETKISPAILTEQSDEQSPDIVNERIVPVLNAERYQYIYCFSIH